MGVWILGRRDEGAGFRVKGLDYFGTDYLGRCMSSTRGIQGLGFGILGWGMGVQGSVFRLQGSGFRLQDLGFRDEGSGLRVEG